jgi:hypothetical protein
MSIYFLANTGKVIGDGFSAYWGVFTEVKGGVVI